MDEPDDVVVARDDDASAYLLTVGGRPAGGAYFMAGGGTLVFTHTEVADEFAGQHLGSRLVRAALDDVRGRGEKVVARCPFVVAFLKRHHEYLDLLEPGQRAQLEAG